MTSILTPSTSLSQEGTSFISTKADIFRAILSDTIARNETDPEAWDKALEYAISECSINLDDDATAQESVIRATMFGFINGYQAAKTPGER